MSRTVLLTTIAALGCVLGLAAASHGDHETIAAAQPGPDDEADRLSVRRRHARGAAAGDRQADGHGSLACRRACEDGPERNGCTRGQKQPPATRPRARHGMTVVPEPDDLGVASHAFPSRTSGYQSTLAGASEIGKAALPPPRRRFLMVFIWVLVALLLLFAIVGGIAITKFLFFVLIVAGLLALIGFFARTA